MSVRVIKGDLLDAKDAYIAHQCNCVSTGAKGVAAVIFKKYPHANTYSNRNKGDDLPGTITICGDGMSKRLVINMYAQRYPTFPKYSNDTAEKRVQWFQNCLNQIAMIEEIKEKTIGMPFYIGCAAAGGDWKVYYKMIEKCAQENELSFNLYKLN